MASKFLMLFKPFVNLTFEVKRPEKKVGFGEKIAWTFAALVMYLVMLSTPIYGYREEGQFNDPFYAMRTILASRRGTLAELGIGPIVTAGLIMQLLVGSQLINVDFNDPDERALYTGAQKVMSVLMTIFEAVAYLSGGAYGSDLAFSQQGIILGQLVAAGIAIMMMDEMVQKGWGLGSGISLFIAASVSFTIFNGMFDTTAVTYAGSSVRWRRGAVLAFIQGFFHTEDFWMAVSRPGRDPDMIGLLATIIVFGVVIYFESLRIEIPVQHTKMKMPARYPIKLLYVSNIPVILVSALFANVYFISNILNEKWGSAGGWQGTISRALGQWESVDGGQNEPVGGLAAYTTAPFGLEQVFGDPLRALIYFLLMVTLCAGFSMVWIETAGMSARDVAKQLLQADMQIPGFRRNPRIIEKYLNNYIPYAAFVGGVFIGILAAFADFIGALGSGVGILLTTGIIKQYYEILAKERLSEMAPGLAGLLGITG